MTAMERSRILRRAVDILREGRTTNWRSWKPSTPVKRIQETSTVDIVTGADDNRVLRAGLIRRWKSERITARYLFRLHRREPLGVVAYWHVQNYPIQIAL